MEYFVRRAGRTICTNIKYDEEESIPTTILKDCQQNQYSIELGDVFIEPGIIISQRGTTVTGKRPNDFNVFSFDTETTLHNFIIDNRRLFALDHSGKAHIYHFNGTTPEIHDIHRQPSGWCVVPKTRMMVTWNILTLRVYDPDSKEDLFLKGHQSRVTTAATGEAIVATGDSQGFVCIWYVSSWKCFHKLKTGDEDILQLIVSKTTLAVRTQDNIYQYDITTGKKIFDVKRSAQSMVYNQRGLIVAHDNVVEFFVSAAGPESKITFEASIERFVSSVHTRCWCIRNRHLIEIDLSTKIEKWPTECLKWVRNPQFPFEHTWPSIRYMDILALAAEEWLPKVTHWLPPRQWFRHESLKNAIWQWVVKHDMSMSARWLFLPPHKLSVWLDLCTKEVENRTKSFEYSEHVMNILEYIYRRTTVLPITVLKWCWFHQGKLRMRPIIMRLVEVCHRYMDIISKEPASTTAILCFHPTTFRLLLDNSNVATFLRLLDAYHTQFLPSDETRKIFQYLVNYVFTNMESENCDIPLPDTGRWIKKTRFMPTDVGKYIKTETDTGFITDVIHRKEEQCPVVLWKTVVKRQELKSQAQIWSLRFQGAPSTLMECALTLLNIDKWSRKETIGPFKWFQSELGAFVSSNQLISIFDKNMRIQSATWNETGASITTSSGMTIIESEGLPIEIETPEWSYIKDATYDLTPLKIKICNIVQAVSNPPAINYSPELLQCCQSVPIIEEHQWEMNVPVTAVATDMKTFVIGLKNGSIYEFEHLSNFSFPMRSFMLHETQLLSIHINKERLLSLSEDTLCIWCLKTGTLLFTKNTEQQFVTAVHYVAMQFWVIEHGEYCSATIWDIEDEIPIKKLMLPKGNHFLSAYHIQDMSVLISTTKAVLWSEERVEHVYDLDITGVITCVSPTEDGIAGGTSTGNIFMLDFNTKQIHEWSSIGSTVVTAMAPLAHINGIISGDTKGNLSIWTIKAAQQTLSTPISTSTIEHIYVESIFAFIVHDRHIKLVSIVQERAGLACQCLYNIMTWSYPWKNKVIMNTELIVKPAVHECLKQKKHLSITMDIIEECTEDYANRSKWCDEATVELLLDMPNGLPKKILKRLITFKGPRIDCPICGDDETKDSVSFLKPCHHRFHSRCIAEHIRKTPEYHQEMQYEYALSVELKCPTCRAPFVSEDVKLDNILNGY